MSDRKPLTTAIRDFARHARNIKGLTDPEEISAHVDRRLQNEGYWTKANILFARLAYVATFSVMRTKPAGKKDERQLHLWNDLDQPFNIHHPKKDPKTGEPLFHDDGRPMHVVKQKELGKFDLDDIDRVTEQKDSNLERAVAERAIWIRAVTYVRPLLASHPGWDWSDAVDYMRENGGLPDLE